MNQAKKNYFYATAILIGQIVGVGIFGLPILIAKAGVLSLLFFIVFIGWAQYFIHLTYANLVIVTKQYHQLPGYADIYLGKIGKHTVFLANLIGGASALLAYIIVSGLFLHQLLGPFFGGNEFVYSTFVFIIEAVIIYFGVHMLARTELILTALLLLTVGLIAMNSVSSLSLSHYEFVNWKYFLIPYGAMLFALDGTVVVPFMVELLKKDKMETRKTIKTGLLISTIVTAVFALAIVGLSGGQTTPDSLSGVKAILPAKVISFALIFGLLCLFTSFLGAGQSLMKIFQRDYRLSKNISWLLAMSVPYILFLIGIDNLTKVISFAGGVSGGLSAMILMLIALKINKKRGQIVIFKHKIPAVVYYFFIVMFAVGIFYDVFFFILK